MFIFGLFLGEISRFLDHFAFVISKSNILDAKNTNFAFVIGKIIFFRARNGNLPIRRREIAKKFAEITIFLPQAVFSIDDHTVNLRF